MIFSKSGEYTGESEDIIKNFFKFCCAIQNFKLKMRGHNQLDDKLLRSYVGAINYDHDNVDFIVMDQINTLKSLVNRKAYCLNHTQISYIHEKFINMHKQRVEWLSAEDRIGVKAPRRDERITPQRDRQPQQYLSRTQVIPRQRVVEPSIVQVVNAVEEPCYTYKEVK